MKTYSDKELLDLKLGGVMMREMTAITFLGWLAGKLDGVETYRADTQELLETVRTSPMTRVMADDRKIQLVRKLEALNIPLV